METKKEVLIIIVGAIFFAVLINFPSYSLGKSPEPEMTNEQYQRALNFQNQYHTLYRAGVSAEGKGDYDSAVQYFEKGLDSVKGNGPETIFRSKLQILQEKAGNLEEALKHTQWFLEKSSDASPLWTEFLETKSRLLQKIEAQKSWEAKQDPVIPKFKKGFEEASPEKQKEFLEGLGGPGIMDVFKEAMVAEHGGDFKKALGIYESLLPRKADIEKEFGGDGWVMIYPAIQRNAEMLKDAAREKEALIWMKENLLPQNARYHTALSKLMPQNVAHIEKRIKDYQL